MKKVLHIISGLGTGGAEMMLYKLLTTANPSSSAVLSLGSKKNTMIEQKLQQLGIDVFYLDLKSKGHVFKCFPRLRTIVAEFKPSVIQGWMYHGNLVTLLIKYFFIKVPIVWNVRHSLHDLKSDKAFTRFVIKLNGLLSRLPNSIVYNSKTSAVQHENYGFSKAKTLIIPNGFDMRKFIPDNALKEQVRCELNVKEGVAIIGCVARVHPTKGHAVLLKAASLFVQEYSHAVFVLVGQGADSENEVIQNLVTMGGLSEKVILLGERSDVIRLTTAFDIATSASLSEAFSNTIGEAMACGVPCVVTDVGDSAWIVGDSGEVVPAATPDAMSQAWLKILKMQASERMMLSKKARKRVEENFGIEQISKRYDELYQSIG